MIYLSYTWTLYIIKETFHTKWKVLFIKVTIYMIHIYYIYCYIQYIILYITTSFRTNLLLQLKYYPFTKQVFLLCTISRALTLNPIYS